MKSPYRWSKLPLISSAFMGLVLYVFILYINVQAGAVLTLLRILAALIPSIMLVLLGWSIAYNSGDIYTREVNHPADPENLDYVSVYWLNGETPAHYVGKMEYTGKLLFHIDGFNDPKDPLDAKAMYPGTVREYISTLHEVPSE